MSISSKFDDIKSAIRRRHIEQLRDLNIVADSFFEISPSGSNDDLIRWSQESEKQLRAGKAHSELQTLCTLL